MSALEFLGTFADTNEAQVVIDRQQEPRPTWSVGVHWGREAPDSPMVWAAAYGIGDTLTEAVEQAAEECGWERAA
jgi:hypothetical protein